MSSAAEESGELFALINRGNAFAGSISWSDTTGHIFQLLMGRDAEVRVAARIPAATIESLRRRVELAAAHARAKLAARSGSNSLGPIMNDDRATKGL
jgi:hypothetical protein